MTFVLIDNSLESRGTSDLFENPFTIIRAEACGEVEEALARLESGLAKAQCFAAGFFSYELGYALEPHLARLMPAERALPLLWLGLFRDRQRMTRHEAGAWLAARARGPGEVTPPQPALTAEAYAERFARVMARIGTGDIYQLNLTFPARFRLEGCPIGLYRTLRSRQPVAHGALIAAPDFHILSLSPELFLARDGLCVETRPMKGTAARGSTPRADRAARRSLAKDAKCRAENLMIVDLMRNDVGRVAQMGSVRVRDLFSIETYPTLYQMTSTVTARLRPEAGLEEIMRGLFPPGSVTGAPKIRAMELIRTMEDAPRGVYTGAIGWLGPGEAGPTAHLNVAIRTAVIGADGTGEIGIGSGLVADSDADAEYEECLVKMRFLTPAANTDFQLIETLRHGPDEGYVLLERHLARLEASADHFGFRFDRSRVRAALDAEAAKLGPGEQMVRLLLFADRSVTVTSSPLTLAAAETPMRYAISEHRVDPDDEFLAHKTTRRALLDGEHARLSKALGCDEVVFLNTRGELTQGSRTNIFLAMPGTDLWLTPALSSGLLPGTLRAELIASGRAREAVLTLGDLARAETPRTETPRTETLWLGNSVRGLRRAEPVATNEALCPTRSRASEPNIAR